MTFKINARFIGAVVAAAPLSMILVGPVSASPNETKNYNFSLGNEDFATNYTYETAPTQGDTTNPGQYGVGTTPSQYNASWANVTPPANYSGGSTNFMIVDGSPKTSPQYVWQESVAVVAGETYQMSDWAVNLDPAGLKTAQLYFGINGADMSSTTTLAGNSWEYLTGSYTATSTGTVKFQVYDASSVHIGNDFGLDDIMFKAAPVPEASTVIAFAVLCIGGFIVLRKRSTSSATA